MNHETRQNFVTKSAQKITRSLVRGLGALQLPSQTTAMVALETVSMVVGIVDGFACLAGVSPNVREDVQRQFSRSGRTAAAVLFAGENDVTPLRKELDHEQEPVDSGRALRLLAAAAVSQGGCLKIRNQAIAEVDMAASVNMPVCVSFETDARGFTHVHARRTAWFLLHRSNGGQA